MRLIEFAEQFMIDLAYTRQVATELRLRFLLARLRYRHQKIRESLKHDRP